jgi:DNA-binding NarL/FixJ family response regulator
MRRALTKRQLTILRLVAAGLLHKQIADQLGIAVRTVDDHSLHLREALGAQTLAHAVNIAWQLELFQ